MLKPQYLSVSHVTWSGYKQNPYLGFAWPAAQMILGWLPIAHNNCISARKLDIYRM